MNQRPKTWTEAHHATLPARLWNGVHAVRAENLSLLRGGAARLPGRALPSLRLDPPAEPGGWHGGRSCATRQLIGLLMALALLASTARAQTPPASSDQTAAAPSVTPSVNPSVNPSAEQLEHWLQMLESDRFALRQQATRQLSQFGQDAVEPLMRAVENGGLEATQRALGILTQLASNQAPDDESGAWAALVRLAEGTSDASATDSTTGHRRQAAQAALQQLRQDREIQAYSWLAASGVQIGRREFVIDSRAYSADVIWIDKNWRGDVGALRWLRWIQGIDHVLLEGPAVRQEVVQQVAKMSRVRTLAMWNASLRDDVLTPLAELDRIDQLEIRYISLGADDAQRLAQLPIRDMLGLMGTGLSAEGEKQLRESLPGVRMSFKKGGFLGVTCGAITAQCQLTSVKPGGAADRAGLAPGDVVIEIDGTAIGSFEDLQAEVGSHFAGDEIEIVYDRFGELRTTTARLGKLEGE